ncbi:hypothetical protein [Elizabethkingia anophelis]|uniref:hypothetical protein n=1 Tax=Elizabethkingia anophelis TaxID=1117645 RepID=UPI0021A7B5EA
MIKNLLKASLWGVLTLSLLSSCRTEDGAITQKQIEDKRFAVFIPKSGKAVNYANGFAYLIQRYDNLHKTNLSGINNNAPAIRNLNASTKKNASIFQANEYYVEFNIRSQVIKGANDDKWVIFPKIEKGVVKDLVVGVLSKNETYVTFYNIDTNDNYYTSNISLFDEAFKRHQKRKGSIALNASIKPMAFSGDGTGCSENEPCKDIEEVEINVPAKPDDGGGTPPLPIPPNPGWNPTEPPKGKCPEYQDCTDYGAPSTPVDEWVIQHIDDRNLKSNKCANDVYQTLKSRVGLFNNLLGDFKGNSSILNLSFNIKPISSPPGFFTTGHTDYENIKNGYISITLNPDALGSTDLGIATTFIHEMIHAKMIHDLVNVGWDGNISLKEINPENLPTLLEAYRKYKYSDDNMSQHKFMSEYYIPKMVTALQQFDGANHSKADYENLVWTGLQTTDAFKALSQSKKDKITEANNTFNRKAPCGK